ncbi:hypothetical protein ABRY23_12800 [Melioribacteraceae bacterium 4301-Me]|uniref:hypothetical protein n=1 Tax=Pyranulibacter aquaticus TaxID=3163344 RepID=UPI003595E444
MKKLFFAVIFLTTMFTGTLDISAQKPAYCNDAYRKCLAVCSDIYSDPLSQAGCNLGCTIGYWNCG